MQHLALLLLLGAHVEPQEVVSQPEEVDEAEEGEDADREMTDLSLPKLTWMLRWRTTRRTWLPRYIGSPILRIQHQLWVSQLG